MYDSPSKCVVGEAYGYTSSYEGECKDCSEFDGDLVTCSSHSRREGLKTIYRCSLPIGMTTSAAVNQPYELKSNCELLLVKVSGFPKILLSIKIIIIRDPRTFIFQCRTLPAPKCMKRQIILT